LPGRDTIIRRLAAQNILRQKSFIRFSTASKQYASLFALCPAVYLVRVYFANNIVAEKLLPDLSDWQKAFLDNLILCNGEIITIAVMIFLARASFARRLKGFGLNLRTIHKDFPAALLNLLSVWPLIAAMIILTMRLGKLILGPDFEIQPHEELELIRAHSQLPVRVLIIVTAVAIVPVFEEMLFRGLFQTMLRSISLKPWLSIVIASGPFVLAHANAGHWPALFVLSLCMGYAYEKSGSLLRPIFIHSLLNATSIIGTLYNI